MGFKSFAGKTVITFNDGITGVVGPNGCGKSNIVDAIRWVLGEQRYSILRSDRMEDVIFNGTKTKKPINVAEVSLTVENSKNILPMEYSEVTITRRVFRSGESEYMINRNVCRLKDILSLFMDTGMGAHAYSVIELKMVETILSEREEDRRGLFEEASGVTRYKVRRKEANRRLKDVEADILRVNDIIDEVEKKVRSLERQAKKATRYQKYAARLQELEIEVLEKDYVGLHNRLRPLEEQLLAARTQRDDRKQSLQNAEALLDVLQQEASDIKIRLRESQALYRGSSDLQHDLEQKRLILQERDRSLTATRQRLEDEWKSHERDVEKLKEDTIRLQRELEEKIEEISTLEARYSTLQEVHLEREKVMTSKKVEISSVQNDLVELVQRITRKKSDLEQLAKRKRDIASALDKMDADEKTIGEELKNIDLKLGRESVGEVHLQEGVLQAEREFQAIEERRQELRREIDVLQGKAFELQGRIGEKMSKIDMINGLLERLEGHSAAVQYLLRNFDWSPVERITVADAVNTKPEYRVAIESVLGESIFYVIVPDLGAAVNGLQALKKHQKGKATFIALSRLPEPKAPPFPIAGDGIVGWAIDHVQVSDEHKPLFTRLLRNVVIVRDEQVANACIREYPNIRCVTLEGDVMESRGLVKGGSHRRDEGGMIGKREQLKQLEEKVSVLKEELKKNQDLLQEKNDEFNSLDLKRAAELITEKQGALTELEKQRAQLLFEKEKHEKTLADIQSNRERSTSELVEINGLLKDYQEDLDRLTKKREEMEARLAEMSDEQAGLEARYNESAEEVNAARVSIVEKTGEKKNFENELQRIQQTTQEKIVSIERAKTHAQETDVRQAELKEEITGLEKKIEIVKTETKEAEEKVLAIETELEEKSREIVALEKTLKEERSRHDDSISRVHEIEMKCEEIRQRIASMKERAQEDFGIDLDAVEIGDDNVFDLAQARDEINTLKQRIKNLGPINQLAYEEYKQEKERLDTLVDQREDLLEARTTLYQTIDEINTTAREKFLETFEKIRSNFISLFMELFDEGDEADLVLEKDADPLEARIEIIAKPRGKRPHSIEMLSQGEKTLTATALLFAIYLVKPSPFCILDEVDAPLDDANIERFLKILRKFSVSTQFIVVTHNKKTMSECDTLYGVTMEEEGVSKMVGVDFKKNGVPAFSEN